MKNSWLSAANRAAGAAPGFWTAEMSFSACLYQQTRGKRRFHLSPARRSTEAS
jgi:hypothetical protein